MSTTDPAAAPIRLLLSSREAAAALSISLRTLDRWRDAGLVPVVRVRGRVLFDPRDLVEMIDRAKSETNKKGAVEMPVSPRQELGTHEHSTTFDRR
ncbi:MAG: helix-turn-helix domain-containing protein [Pirellulales bacterium]|nr:helix-turn-helix domain-containing protein [Pirellulales bacterium]